MEEGPKLNINRKILIFFLSCLICICAQAQCTKISDTQVNPPQTFSGYFLSEKEWGPPNFGESPKTDSQFTALLLKLDKPLEVCSSGDNSTDAITVRCIQVLDAACTPWNTTLYSQHVNVYGALSVATGPAQITPITINCEEHNYTGSPLIPKAVAQLKSYRCPETVSSRVFP